MKSSAHTLQKDTELEAKATGQQANISLSCRPRRFVLSEDPRHCRFSMASFACCMFGAIALLLIQTSQDDQLSNSHVMRAGSVSANHAAVLERFSVKTPGPLSVHVPAATAENGGCVGGDENSDGTCVVPIETSQDAADGVNELIRRFDEVRPILLRVQHHNTAGIINQADYLVDQARKLIDDIRFGTNGVPALHDVRLATYRTELDRLLAHIEESLIPQGMGRKAIHNAAAADVALPYGSTGHLPNAGSDSPGYTALDAIRSVLAVPPQSFNAPISRSTASSVEERAIPVAHSLSISSSLGSIDSTLGFVAPRITNAAAHIPHAASRSKRITPATFTMIEKSITAVVKSEKKFESFRTMLSALPRRTLAELSKRKSQLDQVGRQIQKRGSELEGDGTKQMSELEGSVFAAEFEAFAAEHINFVKEVEVAVRLAR